MAQAGKAPAEERQPRAIRRTEIESYHAFIPGQGMIPGISLERSGRAYFMAGDDSLFAGHGYDDRQWGRMEDIDSLSALRAPVYWARFHFRLAPDAVTGPFVIHVVSAGTVDIHLDGTSLLRASGTSLDLSAHWLGISDSTSLFTFPVKIAPGEGTHVLAVRIAGGSRAPSPLIALEVSLHASGALPAYQRELIHRGLFMGINALILIMALVLWVMDRRDTVWIWLAALSFITLFIVGTDLLEDADLGLERDLRNTLIWCGDVVTFWPICLLVIMLVTLLGNTRRRKLWLYVTSAVALTMMMIFWQVFNQDTLTLLFTGSAGSQYWLPYAMICIILLMAVVIVGFIVELIRLGIMVARTKGFIRWLGAGALLTGTAPIMVVPYVLVRSMVLRSEDQTIPSWLELAADYGAYIGMPLCIVIALAIRSSFQNRMLARQRDDLDKEVHERTAELRRERDRSEELLLNILPHDVAEELKRTGASEARHFDQASVLFSDFKGFTAMSEQVTAVELLQEINTCFKAFDDIIGARGIEKIKTIGDAYMCAGGLPDPKSSSPAEVVFAALEMQAFMEKRRIEREAQGKLAFVMRVGIHSGPVVAGIVGVKKFQYDIWGDTVNTASRMESSGEVGRVNISGATYGLVQNVPGLAFTPRGKVQAKGKGEMEMYFVSRA